MKRIGKLHIALGVLGAALVLGTHGQSVAQGSLTIGGSSANFGVHAVNAGFMPDPRSFSVTSGGRLNVANMNLGAGCTGYATATPDLIVNYSRSGTGFLRFFARAPGDTALVINAADGSWHCNDDSVGTNPMVTLNNAPAGQYDIWLSSYNSGENISGQVFVTELRNQQP